MMPREIAAAAFATLVMVAPTGARAADAPDEPSLVTDLELTAYVCGERRMSLRAARAVPGRARVGFFQTALVPTMELEDVTFERRKPDGSVETVRVPGATVNWITKAVTFPDGTPPLAIRSPAQSLGSSPMDDPCAAFEPSSAS